MKRYRFLIAALLLVAGESLIAAPIVWTQKWTKEYPLDAAGSLWIDNRYGNIEIVGADVPGLVVSAEATFKAEDKEALKEARAQMSVAIGGDVRTRTVTTLLPPIRTTRWNCIVSYVVRVPRSAHVRVVSEWTEKIRIAGIRGNVTVNNVNGPVLLESLSSAVTVHSVNARITYDSNARLSGHMHLQTMTGDIEVRLPGNANFEWNSEAVQGDVRTTFPLRGRMDGGTYRGSVNAPGGPTLTTATLLGNIFVLRKGTTAAQASSIHPAVPRVPPNTPSPSPSSRVVSQRSPRPLITRPLIQGDYVHSTNIGDFDIGQVNGSVRLETGAGRVQLDRVFGSARIVSLGGPLDIGDVLGTLTARTDAGDISVRAARDGGTVSTGGGTVRLLYTGGPTDVQTGGGDIVVRQATSGIKADTRSGDINITMDPTVKSERVQASTGKGSVALNVPSRFGADIEATILTSDPDANSIRSEIPGLTFRREQAGDKTRLRASGKLNGGGERVELNAVEGGIQISVQNKPQVTMLPK